MKARDIKAGDEVLVETQEWGTWFRVKAVTRAAEEGRLSKWVQVWLVRGGSFFVRGTTELEVRRA